MTTDETNESMITFRWALPLSEFDERQRDLAAVGSEDLERRDPQPGEVSEELVHAEFEPITFLIGVAVAFKLAQSIIKAVKDARVSGIVVDATGAQILIKREPSLGGNLILIRDANGARIIDTSHGEQAATLLSALSKT